MPKKKATDKKANDKIPIKHTGRTKTGRRTKYYRGYVKQKKRKKGTGYVKKNPYFKFRSYLSAWLKANSIDWKSKGDKNFSKLSGRLWQSLNKDQKKLAIKHDFERRNKFFKDIWGALPGGEKTGRENDLKQILKRYVENTWYYFKEDTTRVFTGPYFKKQYADYIEFNGNGLTDDADINFDNYTKILDFIYNDLKSLFYKRAKDDRNNYIFYSVDQEKSRIDKDKIILSVKLDSDDPEILQYYRELAAELKGRPLPKKPEEKPVAPPEKPPEKEIPKKPEEISATEIKRIEEEGKTARAKLAIESLERMYDKGKITFEQYLQGLERLR